MTPDGPKVRFDAIGSLEMDAILLKSLKSDLFLVFLWLTFFTGHGATDHLRVGMTTVPCAEL